MGSYCKFCDQRCFVLRILRDGRSMLLATCQRGMEHDREACGEDHTMAQNPIEAAQRGEVRPLQWLVIPESVLQAWSVLPDRECPCKDRCGRKVKIVCEAGWNNIGGWLPEQVAPNPLDVDLLMQVLIYWSPAAEPSASQEEFNEECDRLERELQEMLAPVKA